MGIQTRNQMASADLTYAGYRSAVTLGNVVAQNRIFFDRI